MAVLPAATQGAPRQGRAVPRPAGSEGRRLRQRDQTVRVRDQRPEDQNASVAGRLARYLAQRPVPASPDRRPGRVRVGPALVPTTTHVDEEIVTDSSTELLPGTCKTSGCERLVPDGAEHCGPCKILFGPYPELAKHDDFQEWRPDERSGTPVPPETTTTTPNDAGDDDDPPKQAAPKRPKPPRAAPRPTRRRPSAARPSGTSEASPASS